MLNEPYALAAYAGLPAWYTPCVTDEEEAATGLIAVKDIANANMSLLFSEPNLLSGAGHKAMKHRFFTRWQIAVRSRQGVTGLYSLVPVALFRDCWRDIIVVAGNRWTCNYRVLSTVLPAYCSASAQLGQTPDLAKAWLRYYSRDTFEVLPAYHAYARTWRCRHYP